MLEDRPAAAALGAAGDFWLTQHNIEAGASQKAKEWLRRGCRGVLAAGSNIAMKGRAYVKFGQRFDERSVTDFVKLTGGQVRARRLGKRQAVGQFDVV